MGPSSAPESAPSPDDSETMLVGPRTGVRGGRWRGAVSVVFLFGASVVFAVCHPAPLHAATDPVVVATADVQIDSGLNIAHAKATSDLALSMTPDQAWSAGDQTDDATSAEYATYPQHWGRLGSNLQVVPGNHETHDGPTMPGYLTTFAAQGTPLPRAEDVGAWRVYFLDSNTSFAVGSPSYDFMQADLAAHPNRPIAAVWHTPLWSNLLDKWSTADPSRAPMWDLLYAAHADLIIDGHSHSYQRWTQLTPGGLPDTGGIRQFIVATGGKPGMPFGAPDSRIQYEQNTSLGVLRLVLHPTSYEWQYVSTTGAVLDSGTTPTHNVVAPPTAVSFRGSARFVGNVTTAPVTVPASVQSGDLLLMFATVNVATTPVTAPAGWTALADFVTGTARTTIWRKSATATDAGSEVSLRFGTYTKTVLQLVAYSGCAGADQVAATATRSEATAGLRHTTPTLSASASGGWLVSYWADKSSTTTSWTPPVGVSVRDTAVGSGSGRIGAMVADSGSPVQIGTVGGLAATTNASSRAATVSILVM